MIKNRTRSAASNAGDILYIKYPAFKHYGIDVGNGLVMHNSKKYGYVKKSVLRVC